MGHVCPEHADLNPDYGSCAPLHVERDTRADTLRRWAGDAERRAEALARYAAEHRRAAELSEYALTLDPASEHHAAIRASARGHAAAGRAALHAYNDLSAIRDRIHHA